MTVALVHGLLETGSIWDDLVPLLSEETHVLNLPGHGSPRPHGFIPSKDAYADWLADQVQSMSEPVHLVGHGWGGLFVLRAVTSLGLHVRSWSVDNAGAFHKAAPPSTLSELARQPGEAERRLAAVPTTLASAPQGRVGRLRMLGLPASSAQAVGQALDSTMAACAMEVARSADPNVRADWDVPPVRAWDAGLVILPGADLSGYPCLAREVATELDTPVAPLAGLGHYWMAEAPLTAAKVLRSFWSREELWPRL